MVLTGPMEVLVRKPPVFTVEPEPLYQRKVSKIILKYIVICICLLFGVEFVKNERKTEWNLENRNKREFNLKYLFCDCTIR